MTDSARTDIYHPWPKDIQCVVLLTFDVDGVSSWINRDPEHANLPSLMSMADYGPKVATPRILDLLEQYNIFSTFFIPGFIAETNSKLVENISARGHEIGHHGYMHEPPATLTPKQEHEVIHKGMNIIKSITGKRPIGYRSPSWELSKSSIDLLIEHNFTYDSSLMGDDKPYIVNNTKADKQIVEIPIHWLLDDAPNFVYAPSANRMGPLKTANEVYDSWKSEFEGIYKYGGCFNLTMHPQHIGRPGRLLMLEKLIQYIKTFDHVKFMTCEQVSNEDFNSNS
ncbi:MAG: Peptidoglycan deacetylase [Chloroflexota bacterium]|nr:MAG: Peptidoglycan deacetylase [Chloroflexota bacterium]